MNGELKNASIFGGANIIWGVEGNWELCAPQNIVNLPPDTISIKVRLRPKKEARAYVKTPNSITQYVLEYVDKKVMLSFAQCRNLTRKVDRRSYDAFPHRDGLPVMDSGFDNVKRISVDGLTTEEIKP